MYRVVLVLDPAVLAYARQVVCEVMSIHWDRLDVKVAVRYPKSYGPRGSGGKGTAADKVQTHAFRISPAGFRRAHMKSCATPSTTRLD